MIFSSMDSLFFALFTYLFIETLINCKEVKMIKRWLNSPFTWGSYLKLSGICIIIYAVYAVAYFTVTGLIDPIGWIKEKLNGSKI